MVRPEEVPAQDLTTHLCGPQDRAEQVRLFNACFRKGIDAQGLAWRYDQNPHGRAVSLVSRPPGGQAVCGYACSPRRAVPSGDESHAAPIGQTGDVMTHPDWRRRGIFSSLDRACMQETARLGWPVVFGLPNRHSAHLFLELGWERVGLIRPHTFVLRAGAGARAVLAPNGRLASFLAPWSVHAGRRARARLRVEGAGFEARALERFPAEVVELSRAVERRHSLMVRRDAGYLDWRFVRNTRGLHRAVGLYDPAGDFAGYAVVQLPRPGEERGFLVDLLARDEAATAAALEAGLARLERAGVAAVQAWAVDGTGWRRQLARAGFRPPRAADHLIVIAFVHQPEHPLAVAARDASGWYLTDGDRDDETVG